MEAISSKGRRGARKAQNDAGSRESAKNLPESNDSLREPGNAHNKAAKPDAKSQEDLWDELIDLIKQYSEINNLVTQIYCPNPLYTSYKLDGDIGVTVINDPTARIVLSDGKVIYPN